MHSLISAQGITKRFGSFTAVDHISFNVKPGSIVGFLGPNGAGKTTTIKMIYTAFPPDEGELTVFGLSTRTHQRAIKERLGVVIQSDIIEETGTCLENLRLYAAYFGIPWRKTRAISMKLLETFDLANWADRSIRSLSGGMKRRISIAKGLISNPELLLLDEPTIGLDPQARLAMWDIVRAIRDQGKTILLTTHYMEEAERLCDHIFIMDHGKLIAQGSPSDLIARHLLMDLKENGNGGGRERPPNLEDVFLHLTGREIRNE
jgi:lipooligosaccharide transport system ATP-binding protein